jgi:hypothetical protein
MHERGHQHLLLTVDDPDLEDKIVEVLEALEKEREAIREHIGRTVARHLMLMARMGVRFEEHVRQRYPEFPIRTGTLQWHDYLPPLGPDVRVLTDRYAA